MGGDRKWNYACSCQSKSMKITDVCKIGEMVSQLVNACKGDKAKIKIEVEFSD